MRERALTFGTHRGLVGVLTQPADGTAGPRRAVVVSNIGLHHHVGPYRLYVEMARRLASAGWYVLRFDLSGLGDSEPRPGALSDAEAAVADVKDAMNLLGERWGIEQFVLLGLCSGVDSTHATALADPRVVGAVFIDGYTYPTAGYRLRNKARYLELGRWARFVRRRMRAGTTSAVGSPAAVEAVGNVFAREYPTLPAFRREIGALAARGVRMLFVYTGTVNYRLNARRQLLEMLDAAPLPEQIEVEFYRSVDHLFRTDAHRALLFGRLETWLESFVNPERAPTS